MKQPRRGHLAGPCATALTMALQLAFPSPAYAQDPTADAATENTPPPIPVGLSGTLSNSVVFRQAPAEWTLITVLGVSYQLVGPFSAFGRVGAEHNVSDDVGSATGFANPALGLSAESAVGKHLTLSAQSGAMLPIGSGGGNAPSKAAFRAWTNSVDWGGAMFAVNHVDLFAGARGALVYDRLTLSLESVFHQLIRTRGEQVDPIGPTASVTGSTATVAFAFHRRLVVSTAISETRFWNTPPYIEQSPDSRAVYFLSGGASTSFKMAGVDWSPGLLYAQALNSSLTRQGFRVVELDLGFAL